MNRRMPLFTLAAGCLAILLVPAEAWAHGVAAGDKGYIQGLIVAAFDGAHGWFWRNRGKDVVTLTLRTNGDYQELKRM